MQISEQELRAMVREAIARQTATRVPAAASDAAPPFQGHASHALLTLVTGGDPEGQCIIEPAVRCNHCGYCQSLGH